MSFDIVEIFNDEIKATVQTNNSRYSCIVCGKPLVYGFTKSGYQFHFDPITRKIHTLHPPGEVEARQNEMVQIRKAEKKEVKIEQKKLPQGLD